MIGPGFGDFLEAVANGDCDVLALEPVDTRVQGKALAFVNPETDQLFVMTMSLDERDATLDLAVSVNGTRTLLGTLQNTGKISVIRIDRLGDQVPSNMLASAVFELSNATGVILRTG